MLNLKLDTSNINKNEDLLFELMKAYPADEVVLEMLVNFLRDYNDDPKIYKRIIKKAKKVILKEKKKEIELWGYIEKKNAGEKK